MDVERSLMSRIHKEQRRNKHKRAKSDESASPMDWSDSTDDGSLLVIPDTPSPVFNGRKRKVKLSGKIASSVSVPDLPESKVANGKCEESSTLSPDFAATDCKTDAGSDNLELTLSTTAAGITEFFSKHSMKLNGLTDCNSTFYDTQKQRPTTSEESAKFDLSTDDVSHGSHTIDYHDDTIQTKDVTSKEGELSSSLKTEILLENNRTSDISDIANYIGLLDCDSTDSYHIEDNSDVLVLSSEPSSSSKSKICGSECPQNTSENNYTVSPKHSPKKRLFQNGAMKRPLLETDTLCGGTVSQAASSLVNSHDVHQLFEKPRTLGECSTPKRCINGDLHKKSSRWNPASCRFAGRTEIVPSSTWPEVMSPPSGSPPNSFLHRKHRHMKPHHRKHKLMSGTGTSSASANWHSVSATESSAKVLPRKGKRHKSPDTDGMACYPGFVPAGSLIDLTKTPVPVARRDRGSRRPAAVYLTDDFGSSARRHTHSHMRHPGREKRSSHGSDVNMAHVIGQLEQDEAMARRLQEEMDRDFALALVESENRIMSNSTTSVSDLPHDLAGLEQVIGDITMSSSSVSDCCPVQVRTRGAHACVNVMDSGSVVSVTIAGNTRQARSGRRRGGRRHVVQHYEPEQNDGNDYEFLLRLGEQIGDVTANTGLCRQHIDLLPQRLFSGPQAGRDISCNICMCDYETGDNLRMLPCFHEFHQLCIDQWIQKNATCPICRVDIEVGQS